MDLKFDGKTAIVTGGASGIGAAVVDELAAGGATVVVADLKQDACEAKVAEIEKAGGKALPFALDVSDADQVKAMVDFAVAETGKLDLLVNNAGIGGPLAPVGEVPVDEWHALMGVNLHGVFYGLRFAIPEMLKTGGGAIVNMASILGSVGSAGPGAYVSAKHAVVGLTKAAALEYSAHGIRINSVGPGYIDTPLLEALPREAYEGLKALHPIGRLGKSEEVAALVAFLLSDRASFITGSYHLVDGAYTAQ